MNQPGSDIAKLVRAIIADPKSVDELRAAISAPAAIELIAMPRVQQIAGLSRSEIWRRVANKTFPGPCRLATRCTRWSRLEVEKWCTERLAAREQAA